MKVNESASVAVPAVATRVAQPAEQKEVEDRVSFSTPQQEAALRSLKNLASDPGRAARVQEVVNAVRSGQYYPSPQQIAQEMVTEAETAAELRTLLQKK